MLPHPDIGKDQYRRPDTSQIRCGWQAALALAMLMVAATLLDLATQSLTEPRTVLAATQEGGR